MLGHFSHKTLIGGVSRVAKKRKMKKKKKEERKKDLINLMRRGWVTLRSRASELSRPRPVAPRCERFCNPNPIQNPSPITHAPDAPHCDGAAAEPACDFLLTGWLLLLLQRRQPTADAAASGIATAPGAGHDKLSGPPRCQSGTSSATG